MFVLRVQDANVGAHILKECAKGRLLHNRTCIMVTNQLHILPQFDVIYVMKDVTVSECGTYDQLMRHGKDLKRLMATHNN